MLGGDCVELMKEAEMRRGSRIMHRGLLAFVIGTTLVMTSAVVSARAKEFDAIGQNPTARYADGRGADERSSAPSPPNISGIEFEIASVDKFWPHKN